MKCLSILSALLLSMPPLSHAEGLQHQHGLHTECELPKVSQDIIKCALKLHPSAKRAELLFEQAQFLSQKAGQVSNPELDVESAQGKGGVSSLDLALLMPIEWGGKRSSRIAIANSEIGRAEAERNIVLAEIAIETVKNLHRLRQMEVERKVYSETLTTLKKLVEQQAGRPHLSAEQQVTLSLYRMVLADSKLKESELFEEERRLEHFFHRTTGHSLEEIHGVMPNAPKSWPSVSERVLEGGVSVGSQRALAESNYNIALAASARAEAWPEFKLGPIFKVEQSESERDELIGFRLMMDLPIFNFNGGGRSFANAGVNMASKLQEQIKLEEGHERIQNIKIYRNTVEALSGVLSLDDINKEYRVNQKLANRGLISGTVVIEFHRQRTELIKSRHSRELKAIETLWQIYKLDGRIFKESI